MLSGPALDRILEFTEAERADLVVVGASTRPTVTERLLGSVSLALIHRSSRPVIVVTDPSHG